MVGATDRLTPLKSGREGRSTVGVYSHFGKRILDIVLVLLAAPIVLPLIAGLALWIRLQGYAPFYVQDRVGKGGRTFRLWKLQTMVPDADAALKIADFGAARTIDADSPLSPCGSRGYVAPEVLTTKKSGRGMMSISPDQAVGYEGTTEDIIQLSLKKAAAEGYEHGSKIQARARERLAKDRAFKLMDPIV